MLTINGDSARNALSVGQTTAGVITLNGTPVLGGTVTANNLSRIVVVGGAADDTLQVDETNGVMIPAIKLHGGAGNDQLFGGSGADTLDGGPGVDTLVGNAGADTLLGGAGNDKAIGGPGIDTVDLGEDSTTASATSPRSSAPRTWTGSGSPAHRLPA